MLTDNYDTRNSLIILKWSNEFSENGIFKFSQKTLNLGIKFHNYLDNYLCP
jgi:hypothetical protein